MSYFQSLFSETRDQDINPKHLKRMSRNCRHVKNDFIDHIPKMNYPKVGTEVFEEDLAEVIRCYETPSLTTSFLKSSDNSIESIYKQYLDENGYHNVDWKLIKKLLEDVDTIILKLKYAYKRPRPVVHLQNLSDDYMTVKYNKSPSFPSGHTAIAFFLCDILSNFLPDVKNDMQTLASLVGQSRIENAVHYPSDISYGRLVGETLADLFLKESDLARINKSIKPKHYRGFSKFLEGRAQEIYKDNDKDEALLKYANDIANFIHRSNEIEMYNLDYSDCLSAVKDMMMGFPVEYVTDNPHIRSHINGLVCSHIIGNIDNIYKIFRIHEQFDPQVIEQGVPGEMRNFSHVSRSGTRYPEPCDIVKCLRNIFNYNDKPYTKHMLYEWVHPFCDGNGRSGRIILVADANYDFEAINHLISENYISTVIDFMTKHDLNKILNI